MEPREKIESIVNTNPVVLFMKGSPQFPQCGFSARTVEVLKSCDIEFLPVDVIAEPEFRQNLPAFSEWPTFPQLFIGGELVGGCDIVMDMYRNGDLQRMADEATTDA